MSRIASAGAGTSTAPAKSQPVEYRHIAVLALLGTSAIWGTAAVATKTALETYPPFILSSTRWTIALMVMTPVLIRSGIRPVLNRYTLILGLCGMALFNGFYSFGLERTTAATASLINGSLPVMVALLSFVFLRERLVPLRWFGIILSMTGISLTVLGATLDASVTGNLLIFGSVIVWSIYTIVNREKLRGENPKAVTVGAAIFGLMFMLPLAAWEWVGETPPFPDPGVGAMVIYLALGPSLAAILLWTFALSRVPASQAAAFSNLNPIVGIVAAAILLGEPVTRFHILGGVLVILGVFLTTWRRPPPVEVVQDDIPLRIIKDEQLPATDRV